MMTNKNNTVIYTGVTNNLERRVFEHVTKFNSRSFTSRYNVSKLVWYEAFWDIRDAISREKQIKGGPRWRKLKLIEEMNPSWRDLSDNIK